MFAVQPSRLLTAWRGPRPVRHLRQKAVPEQHLNYVTACSGCDGWSTCKNCTISDPELAYLCVDVPPHTSSPAGDRTLASLFLEEGYWRSSNASTDVRKCHNHNACVGGMAKTCGHVNFTHRYCSTGYTGPCESVVGSK